MDIVPAVDIQRGRVARAPQGIGDDPAALAESYATRGAAWVHVVDLDRALGTGLENDAVVQRVCRLPGVRVQVGGNPMDPSLVELYADAGAARIVLGAGAVLAGDTLRACRTAAGGAEVGVAVEVTGDRLYLRSGPSVPGAAVADVLAATDAAGIGRIVYRHVDRDGRLTGLDLRGAATVLGAGRVVMVAGGAATLDDIRDARRRGFGGVIVGRALLDRAFDLEEALACGG